MFPLPEIQKELSKFVLVRLYVEDKDHAKIQDRLIHLATLPSYVILRPGTESVVQFTGYDVNPATRVSGFAQFLAEGAEAALAD